MATGVPKSRRPAKSETDAASARGELPLDVTLSYAGKRTEREILGGSPSPLRAAWQPSSAPERDNRLYFAENLDVLITLLRDPAVRGKVRLVYIDPPYATKSVFQSRAQDHAYEDLLEGAHYVEYIRERLILLRELMADDGSIYVHLDEKMAFHIKLVMDEVFGRRNYRNWITRKKCNPKNYTRKTFGNVSDFILFYTKSDVYVWNRPIEKWTPERAAKEYEYVDAATGRRFKKVPVHAPGVRNGETGKPWRGMLPPPGKHWQYTPETLDAMDARGEIYWSANGNPRRKVFLDQSEGVAVQDIWMNFRDAHNQNIKITGYPTEKNPDLLERIILASSNPGDLVLDAFSGSGTTLAQADRLGRRWIGIDSSPEAIKASLRRFAEGTQRMGDFVSARLSAASDEPSLFDEADAPAGGTPTDAHTPITEFVLFADDARMTEATQLGRGFVQP